jgi:hypothetical protein
MLHSQMLHSQMLESQMPGQRGREPAAPATAPGDFPDRRGPGGRHRGRWARSILEPAPEDRGPLAPGEAEALRQFVDEQLPELARLLRQIDEQQPGAVARGFPRLAPRLRALRRIHAQNPELAQLIARHAGNMFRLELLRRAWQQALDAQRQGRATPGEREAIVAQMRARIAENTQVEIDVLTLWAAELEANRDVRLAERRQVLLERAEERSFEPPEIRQILDELPQADEVHRAKLLDRLTRALERQLDRQIAMVRRRADELRAQAAEEVDARLERLLQRPGPRKP